MLISFSSIAVEVLVSLSHTPLAVLVHLLSVMASVQARFCQFFLFYSHFKSKVLSLYLSSSISLVLLHDRS